MCCTGGGKQFFEYDHMRRVSVKSGKKAMACYSSTVMLLCIHIFFDTLAE